MIHHIETVEIHIGMGKPKLQGAVNEVIKRQFENGNACESVLVLSEHSVLLTFSQIPDRTHHPLAG